MNWQIQTTKRARKSIKKIPHADREKILAVFAGMQTDPLAGDIKRLETFTPAYYRRRVGNWRVFFTVLKDERQVIINDVKRRTTTTY